MTSLSSTNKTQHLSLCQWVPDDPPLREDFNSDNRKIDDAVGALQALTADLPERKPGLAAYTSPGTYSFTAPKTTNYIVEVTGGGGLFASTMWGHPWRVGGGGGGYAKKLVALQKGDVVTVTVGAPANNGLNPIYNTSNSNWNAAGGASSFGAHVTAPGGSGPSGGIPSSGDVNIPGSPGGEEPVYIPGTSFLGTAGMGAAAGFGAGSGYNYGMPGEPSGATGGCCLITWI